ncbi:MAG: SDR family NAD(P)-dependent oxidoreductase [Acidobacteriota bacterium]|nr:SDR family NAD(P)-dependent oxidoreductase [Acidobacteriota bacterium]
MGVLDGKVAAVTGAGRGIGREVAKMLAAEGAKVLVNDLGGDVDGTGGSHISDQVVEEISAGGGEATPNYDTVATVEGGRGIVQTALDTYGGLDILVNNAGILRDKTLFNLEEEDWDAVIAVHLRGHYCCSRPFARYIRETSREGCRIINFSSVSGLYGNFGQSNYGAAKAGIAGFSRVLALELAKYRCTVNILSPGASTRMTIALREARGTEVDVDAPDQSPRQIAPVVAWLASDAAQDVTGQIIDVMQGWVGIMQQPKVIRSFTKDGHWSLGDLDSIMPRLMEAKARHDEQVAEAGAPEQI